MWQVDEFVQVEARGMVVGQGSKVGEFRLAHDEPGSGLIKEHVMHDTAPPDDNPMLATEPLIPD